MNPYTVEGLSVTLTQAHVDELLRQVEARKREGRIYVPKNPITKGDAYRYKDGTWQFNWAELERRHILAAKLATLQVGDAVRVGAFDAKVAGFLGERVNVVGTQPGYESAVMVVEASKVAKIEPPKPQPISGQVYRHRETTDEKPHVHADGTLYVLFRYDGHGHWSHKFSVATDFKPGRDRTDPERMVASGEYVPYTPPVISNATHAGRRVRHSTLGDGRVVDSKNAARWIKGLGIPYKGVVVAFDNGNMDGFSHERFTLLD